MRLASPRILCPLAGLAVVLTAAPLTAMLAFQAAPPGRSPSLVAASPTSDSADAIATVERFRSALARGDSVAVLAMLAPDAIVLESGDVESRAEYRRHHLPADIEYARAIPGRHTLVQAAVHGDVAWVSSSSITEGRVKGRAINSAGAELIVLSRGDRQSAWQVRAIHWSSRRRK